MNDIVTSDGSPDDHEIESSRAPLMDHLIELRSRLIWMVLAFAAAFILCFAFAEPIYIFLTHPYEMANRMFEASRANGGHGAGPFDLIEVILGLKDVPQAKNSVALITTAPLEFLFTKMKMAGFGAVILSFPIIAFQVYRFVAPGLYKRERMAFLPFLIAAPVLFILGALLVYFIILPMVLWFSLSQQILGAGAVTVQLMPKVSEYLSLVTTLMLAFGLCFQLPIVLTLLGLTGIVSAKMLGQGRRYAILAIVVVAAIVTPPDPISQLMLAIPIVLLYEISIICVRIIEWRRKEPSPVS
ncbi:twin-arginine translocase subunit TatC [Asticcacaulis sp. YBE204]|uniref:twin-arginine translocase subunit TatC n=1 Tax=Asticcacaulis sp. YBE204 TaxID=1282363 RepID=UPI0003C411C5|nr:twin-arginine translocase subunit TatC [Asticcacaulis sp. YBE204]ESQ80492.1 MttB family protein [Asticcacaulis sp. YBE204]